MAPTATKTPPRAPRADALRNRAKVLEAARKVFARDGLEAQMDEVARLAGVGVGTVYRHFPNKEDLLTALAEARFEGLASAARGALQIEDPWEAFVEFMTYSAGVMAEDRLLSEAMMARAGTCSEAAERAGLRDLTAQLVERAKLAGALRADVEPTDVPGLVCGIGRATIGGQGGPPPISWQRYLDIMLAGLRGPG